MASAFIANPVTRSFLAAIFVFGHQIAIDLSCGVNSAFAWRYGIPQYLLAPMCSRGRPSSFLAVFYAA